MLHLESKLPDCCERPEKLLHVPKQSDRRQIRAIFPLHAESNVVEPNVTSQQNDDEDDDAQRIVTAALQSSSSVNSWYQATYKPVTMVTMMTMNFFFDPQSQFRQSRSSINITFRRRCEDMPGQRKMKFYSFLSRDP